MNKTACGSENSSVREAGVRCRSSFFLFFYETKKAIRGLFRGLAREFLSSELNLEF